MTVDTRVLSEFAFECALNGNWQKGISSLTEALIGLPKEYAEKTLSGEYIIVNDGSGANFVLANESEKQDIVALYQARFGSFLVRNGAKYKTTAYVLLPLALNANASELIDTAVSLGGGFIPHSLRSLSFDTDFADLTQLGNAYFPELISQASLVIKVKHSENSTKLVLLEEAAGELPPWCEELAAKNDSELSIALESSHSLMRTCKLSEYSPEIQAQHQSLIDREAIWKQNGLASVTLGGVKVPKMPLDEWCQKINNKQSSQSQWCPISKSGLRFPNDEPCHSDWMIGAGFFPSDCDSEEYSKVEREAYAYAIRGGADDLTNSLCIHKARFSDLSDKIQIMASPIEKVVSSIVLIDDSSTKWIKVAKDIGKKGGIIIAQSGGALSHLSINSKEYGLTLFVAPNAKSFISEGSVISYDATATQLKIQ